MWDCRHEQLDGGRTERFIPQQNGSPIPYRNVLRYWQDEENFRTFFISLLTQSSFSGYRWETPPVTMSTADRRFEFVLLDTPGLDRNPDQHAFARQFEAVHPDRSVIAFANLGNDALLVVPGPAGPEADYVHLASFIRRAAKAQVHELWRVVGATMQAQLSAKPIWLSTAGMGVSWLHVRLDSRPKYYGFGPYRE